jgi:putative CocE/NonD family hydrolase
MRPGLADPVSATARWPRGPLTLAVVVLLLSWPGHSAAPVSAFGVYRGYARAQSTDWRRTSEYVVMSDGVQIAIDLYRPPDASPRPVLWGTQRYHRTAPGRADATAIGRFVAHGYVVAIADVRGGGASFGVSDGPFAEREARDAFEITEWLGTRPWSNGRVGMIGTSYGGIIQYFAASEAPPHLRAIFPEKALFDLYGFVRPGGVYLESFARAWSDKVQALDTSKPAPPVDGDGAGALRDAAQAGHRRNRRADQLFGRARFRDSVDPGNGEAVYARSPSQRMARINRAGVPTYHLTGWFDLWVKDALLWFRNFTGPQRLVIGPWSHAGTQGFDRSAEQLRW